jgi:hypothetical protein
MPPINLNIVGACENIRREAETLAGQNYAFNMQRKTGALDFITSPENGGVDASLISYQQGTKIATLRVFYDQRTKECQITDDCYVNVCDDGSTPLRKEFTVSIDDCIKTPVREYTVDDMVALCKDTAMFMRERGFSDLRAAREHLSVKILAAMDAMKGVNKHFDGTTTAAGSSKTLDLIGTSGGQDIPLPGNFAFMPLDYENMQFVGVPAVIGQGKFHQFFKLQNYSCCNATTPYGEANVESEVRFYLDQAANSVLGDNDVLMAAPGAVHLLTFNENRLVERMGTNTNQNQSIVIPDPAGYPFSWNFDLYWDICTKTWKSQYSLLWGIFNTFQDDSFASNSETTGSPDCSDELDNVKGVWGYSIT